MVMVTVPHCAPPPHPTTTTSLLWSSLQSSHGADYRSFTSTPHNCWTTTSCQHRCHPIAPPAIQSVSDSHPPSQPDSQTASSSNSSLLSPSTHTCYATVWEEWVSESLLLANCRHSGDPLWNAASAGVCGIQGSPF